MSNKKVGESIKDFRICSIPIGKKQSYALALFNFFPPNRSTVNFHHILSPTCHASWEGQNSDVSNTEI